MRMPQSRAQIVALQYSGMAKDAEVVGRQIMLSGWQVEYAWRRPLTLPQRVIQKLGVNRLFPARLDLNIFMQQPESWWIPQARRSVVIPNADWFTDYGIGLLPRIDQLWCKTREAVGLFGALGARCEYLGFTGVDPTDTICSSPQREWREALHIAGSSALKGTAQVIDAWARNPGWPMLNLVTAIDSFKQMAAGLRNVHVWPTPVAADQLAGLQMRCGVHVQPSETEGYGHVLSESLACGALLVTVDAAPMNELVQDSRGCLVPASPTSMHFLARRYRMDDVAFDQAMNAIWDTPVADLEQKGANARAWFLENRAAFHNRIRELLVAAAPA